jgi:integrase
VTTTVGRELIGRPVIVRVHADALNPFSHDAIVPDGPTGAEVTHRFNLLGLPEGYPFVLAPDSTFSGTDHLNRYLLAAHRAGAYDPRSLSTFHAKVLTRYLAFLWRHRGSREEMSVTTTADLIAYKDERSAKIAAVSWDTEIGCVSQFFTWAIEAGFMAGDPIPRWGTKQRNTLRVRLADNRTPKFLNDRELNFFLHAGLGGEAVYANVPLSFVRPRPLQPASPARDFALGFIEVTTGLRREETAGLLDIELPSWTDTSIDRPPFLGSNIFRFIRYGKLNKPRWVYMTEATIDAIDLYRDGERARAIDAAQTRLKSSLGDLLVVNDVRVKSGKSQLHIDKSWRDADRLGDADRARAVRLTDDGRVEPLGLLVTRSGLPPALNYLNEIYSLANERVAATDHPDTPTIRVGNHTMRHTFAVRTLAALIQHSQVRADTPYALVMNPVFVVQELLGHSDPETTARYLHAAERYEPLPAVLRNGAVSAAKHFESELTGG